MRNTVCADTFAFSDEIGINETHHLQTLTLK